MLKPNWYPGQKQLRQFALACLPGFTMIGFMVHRLARPEMPLTQDNVFWGLSALGGLFCLVGLALPGLLWPVYVALMAVAMPIGFVVSNLLLRIIFYLILAPLGLAFRLAGRDPLLLKKPNVDSFWQPHLQRSDPRSYYRQS